MRVVQLTEEKHRYNPNPSVGIMDKIAKGRSGHEQKHDRQCKREPFPTSKSVDSTNGRETAKKVDGT